MCMDTDSYLYIVSALVYMVGERAPSKTRRVYIVTYVLKQQLHITYENTKTYGDLAGFYRYWI